MSQFVILKPGQWVEGVLIPTDAIGRIATIQKGTLRVEGFNPDLVFAEVSEPEDGSLRVKFTGIADTGRTDGAIIFDGDSGEEVKEVRIPVGVICDNWEAVGAKFEFGEVQNPEVDTLQPPVKQEDLPSGQPSFVGDADLSNGNASNGFGPSVSEDDTLKNVNQTSESESSNLADFKKEEGS